ncbi:MAG: chemotaxis protein CheW [Gammaproteobacteria bacterium]|nr:chemotaxis protein CheW [Gammaproteobacteria bacterium]
MSNISKAYLKLVDIAGKSKANASTLPDTEEIQHLWSGVGFSMGGQRYVAPLGEVAEILTLPDFTVVPGVKSWVKGIANVRGRLLPIMDLMGFLQRPSQQQLRTRRLLVIDEGELYSGLLVDELYGMQHFPADELVEYVAEEHEGTQQFIQGGYRREDELWKIFSLRTIAANPDFLHVAL